MKFRIWPLALVLFCAGPSLQAGVFLHAPLEDTDPFIIVHPSPYTGTGGALQISICASSPETKPAIRESIRLWNDLSAMTGNCLDCLTWEDPTPDPPLPPLDMRSVLFHELGHCAFGIDHPNWNDGENETSFTNSQDAVSISAGTDAIRGSRDDLPNPLPGTRLIHWFRMTDNDPIVIDGTLVDQSTYTRRIIDLPTGSTWPASANRIVADGLGAADTQSAMYSLTDFGARVLGPTADDVSTIKFGMAGLDLTAGTTDDYTVELVYEKDCTVADIRVDYIPIDGPLNTLGVCTSTLEPIGSAPVQVHFRVVPLDLVFEQLVIEIDVDESWEVLFVDDFETGTAARWSSVVP